MHLKWQIPFMIQVYLMELNLYSYQPSPNQILFIIRNGILSRIRHIMDIAMISNMKMP